MGCAAITLHGCAASSGPDQAEKQTNQDLESYLTSLAGLASYAVPQFLRVLVDVDEKGALQRGQIGICDSVGGEYVSLMLKKLKTGLRKEGTCWCIAQFRRLSK